MYLHISSTARVRYTGHVCLCLRVCICLCANKQQAFSNSIKVFSFCYERLIVFSIAEWTIEHFCHIAKNFVAKMCSSSDNSSMRCLWSNEFSMLKCRMFKTQAIGAKGQKLNKFKKNPPDARNSFTLAIKRHTHTTQSAMFKKGNIFSTPYCVDIYVKYL